MKFLAIIAVSASLTMGNLIVDYAKMQTFFGGKPAKVAWLDGDKIKFVDFSQEPLTVITVLGGAEKNGNIQVSPDGESVAYFKNEQIYVAPLKANATGTKITQGINPQWWVHPGTGVEYLLVQRGLLPGNGNGIFTQELDADRKPVGEAKFFLMDPMANAGRSPDGIYLANEDEEHEQCWRGHGFYEVDDGNKVENAEIKYWVYVSAETWYNSSIKYSAYCNGSMSPAAPSQEFYGAMLHMGSGHTDIYIRKPENYRNLPLVKNQDTPAEKNCPNELLMTRHDVTPPMIHIPGPRESLDDSQHKDNDPAWGYSDWSNHPDFIAATGGRSGQSKKNPHGYFINLSAPQKSPEFGIQFADGGISQPDLWVGEGGNSSINWYRKNQIRANIRRDLLNGELQLRDLSGKLIPFTGNQMNSKMGIVVPGEKKESKAIKALLIP